ncbi:hypothetical protein Syun_022787 [Stephania yunnanensis]|uniref:Uncharacterized protein n=1 Tax=Stephania yunnanensis TaxID=152371 RepID=A0AAP0F7P0_9MAGN
MRLSGLPSPSARDWSLGSPKLVIDAKGTDVDLSTYKGKTLLIISFIFLISNLSGVTNSNNTELAKLYEKYIDQGMMIFSACSSFVDFLAYGLNLYTPDFSILRDGVLINQLKEVAPTIQKSIEKLTEEVNSISSTLPLLAKYNGRSTSPMNAQSSGRMVETNIDDIFDVTAKFSTVQLEKVAASPTLKLPHLFSSSPNSYGKAPQAVVGGGAGDGAGPMVVFFRFRCYGEPIGLSLGWKTKQSGIETD